jgi:signal transduction histidine kinase
VRLRRPLTSTGVRLAFVQALLLITVFAVAGSLTKVSVKLIYRHEVQTRIMGEVTALAALSRAKGEDAVAREIEQAARHPGGLEYRLTDATGRALAGDLPATGAGPGWTYLDWDDKAEPGRPFQDLMIYTQPLPDHTTLTVGQDLSEESKLRHALKRTLLWCGAAGAALGLVLSYLFSRGALKRVEGVVSAARAVTGGQMQVRAKVRRALIPDDIDELGASFNVMLDEIATLVSRVRWVSTDIAHDLRTPLTHVRQKLERIKINVEGSALAAATEIEADVDELLRTFDAMLKLAEIETEPETRAENPFDLAEVAGRVADAYRLDIEASGRHLTTTLEPISIDGEPDLIAQALANLLENALRHSRAGARIELRVEGGPGAPSLNVIDDGPGIPEQLRDIVTERLVRLDASRTTPGSGLGLAIVAAIVKRHGARLSLTDAAPGLRATIFFQPNREARSARPC